MTLLYCRQTQYGNGINPRNLAIHGIQNKNRRMEREKGNEIRPP